MGGLMGKNMPLTQTDSGVQKMLGEFTSNQGMWGQNSLMQNQTQNAAQQWLQKAGGVGGINEFYSQNILPALLQSLSGSPQGIQAVQDLYGQNRGLAMAQAKEQAGTMGSAAGTGLYEGLGGVVNRSLADQQALIAQMQNQAMDRQLNAAGGAANILGGPVSIYGAAADIGQGNRNSYMQMMAPSAAPQQMGYQPGLLEQLISAGGQVAGAYMGRPPRAQQATEEATGSPQNYYFPTTGFNPNRTLPGYTPNPANWSTSSIPSMPSRIYDDRRGY